ncbi:site-specific integrase [Paracoccus onubensis]|uniref:hypothetical protein n=1 Tax=Paracoccus onubensis TaxID=1675788 RepID=UPI0015FFF5E4|nr:hypothetical protein [Paracoccus onubensis]
MRITPDAGTVKAGHYRDVPLHQQVIAEGFIQFVERADEGPLFHNGKDPERYAAKAVRMSNTVGTWLQKNNLVPAGIWLDHQSNIMRSRRETPLRRQSGSCISLQAHTGTEVKKDTAADRV